MNDTNVVTSFVGGIVLALLVCMYGIAGISDVNPGEVGILVKKIGADKGMQGETLNTGFYWVEPFRFDVIVYDVRKNQYLVEDLPAQSADGQPILVDLSLEIGLVDKNVPFLHETIGRDWYDRVVYPIMRSSVRNETAEHLSDSIYTGEGRKAIQDSIQATLIDRATEYGIDVLVNLRDLKFTNSEFVATLEQKARASQKVIIEEREAEAAEQTAIKMANLAEGEKQKRIKAAEAQREELRLQGEGERLQQEERAQGILAVRSAEAEGNRLQVTAFGDGSTYASVRWAEELGPNVKVLGYPLGAEGTTSLFGVDGVLGDALRVKGAQGFLPE